MYDEILEEYWDLYQRMMRASEEISSLPRGTISHKTIRGKQYAYLQRRENGKMTSRYLNRDEEPTVKAQLQQRKEAERLVPKLRQRIDDLDRAASLIGHGLDRQVMVLKLSSGMDQLSPEEREQSASFADAINALEGVSVPEETRQDIEAWKQGKREFLDIYHDALKRYGFFGEAV